LAVCPRKPGHMPDVKLGVRAALYYSGEGSHDVGILGARSMDPKGPLIKAPHEAAPGAKGRRRPRRAVPAH
jgi:hypothetical protein